MVGGLTAADSACRCFIALPLSAEERTAVDGWRAGLDLPGRPVPPDKLHVTLRFVGKADPSGRDRIAAELDRADLGGPFSFRVGGVGGFPKVRKATVAWAALENDGGGAARLAEAVEEAVAAAGFGAEERPFRGHLTLARIRPPGDLRRAASLPPARIRVRAAEVVLYRSRTGSGPAVYEPLERFLLR